MNRRHFIGETTALVASTYLPLNCNSMETKSTFKMGYQLFSIRDEMAKDPIATLQALKAMGYEDFEAYGFDEEKGMFYGYKAAEFKKILTDMELTVTSGHYGFSPYLDKSDDDLRRFVDKCIKGAKTLESPYITWPWIAPEQRTLDNFKLMSRKLNLIGEQVTKAGLGFAYHNHGFEFEDHNGENGYDIIMSDTDPSLVKLQIDMYWVMHSSSFTPSEIIQKEPGRFVMWHIKDMDKVSRDYTELGNGSIDYIKLLPDPVVSGLEFCYIEQGGNFAHSSMKSAEDSAIYYKKNLMQFL